MDVTDQILKIAEIYGSSDHTDPAGLSSCRLLSLASGGSITKPSEQTITVIPYQLEFKDSVGLFGVENRFLKIQLNLQDTGTGCYEESDWECCIFSNRPEGDTDYVEVLADATLDLTTENTYEPVRWSNDLLLTNDDYVSVDVKNLKTGNKYIDAWFDVRIYTMNREEHPYDTMYCHPKDYFYIGFHARNTRRLPYDVKCEIGNDFIDRQAITNDQRRYIMRR